MSEPVTRHAVVRKAPVDTVKAYLPGNYEVVATHGEDVIIGGFDHAGWTLEDYVIPRLASGLYFCEVIDWVDQEWRQPV